MPTAEMAPDAQLSTTVSFYGSGRSTTTRTTLTFQLLPRLTASFRYSGIGGIMPDPAARVPPARWPPNCSRP
ncbi:hypothetical protein DC366_11295 [Pelagivirga sediminicola]|uniref:Uncharacterized protein n=2 Tax=Pelagivirga sediminicola TaxID=2170575 RepID=A0A2T7G674_9RHOB|nr:hypothetical protein DC366_11295 [Pelagivirga sediminicola]